MAEALTGIRGDAARARRYRLMLAAILLAAFVLRVAARAATGPADFYTHGYTMYLGQALGLAAGRGYASIDGIAYTERPPGYALFLTALRGHVDFWPFLLAQAAVGTATVAGTAALARSFAGRRAALAAAAIAAVYPYYVRHDTALQETALFTLLNLAATLAFLKARATGTAVPALAAGACMGLATLVRPTAAAMLLIAPLWLLLASRAPHRVRNALLALALGAAVVAPWLARQHALLGSYSFSAQTGRGLYVGNNPDTFAAYPERSIDLSQSVALDALRGDGVNIEDRNAPALQRQLRDKAIAWARAHPAQAAYGALRKNMAAFGPLPSPRLGVAGNLAHGLSYGPVLLLALAAAWPRRRDPRIWLIAAQFAMFAVVTGLFWGHTSHRVFLDVFLIALAGVAIAQAWPAAIARLGTQRPAT